MIVPKCLHYKTQRKVFIARPEIRQVLRKELQMPIAFHVSLQFAPKIFHALK
jgi:hypothetical protein